MKVTENFAKFGCASFILAAISIALHYAFQHLTYSTKAREVRRRCFDGQSGATAGELAIHRRVSRLKYSRRCAEASAVQAHMKQRLPLAPGMEIGYVVRDAHKWEVDPERTASKFDAAYYRGPLEKA